MKESRSLLRSHFMTNREETGFYSSCCTWRGACCSSPGTEEWCVYNQQSLAFFFVPLLHNPAPTSVLLPLMFIAFPPHPHPLSVHYRNTSNLLSQRVVVANSKFPLGKSRQYREKNVKEGISYQKNDKTKRQHSNVDP